MQGKIRRRKKRDSEFSTVYNNPFQRDDMSAKAKGILIYLMTLPEDWTLYKKQLITRFTEGKDAINSGLAELEKHGYFITIKYRVKGRFVYDYFFNDEPYNAEEIAAIQKDYEQETAPEVDSHQGGLSAAVEPQRLNRAGQPAPTKEVFKKDLPTKDLYTKDLTNQNQDHTPENNNYVVINGPAPTVTDEQVLTQAMFGLKMPMSLRQHFKRLVPVLVEDSFNIFDVETFYQKNLNEFIKPDCDYSDFEHLSDAEFTFMIQALHRNAKRPIMNTYGLVKSWTLNAIAFKREAFFSELEPPQKEILFYNWLEERE